MRNYIFIVIINKFKFLNLYLKNFLLNIKIPKDFENFYYDVIKLIFKKFLFYLRFNIISIFMDNIFFSL